MNRHIGRVTLTALIAVCTLLATAAVAAAYWKTTGSGSGSNTLASSWTEDTGIPTTLSIDTMTANSSGHSMAVTGKAAKGTAGDGTVTIVFCTVNTWPCPTSGPNRVASSVTVTQTNINGTTGDWSTNSGNVGNNVQVWARATQPRTSGTLTSNVKGPVTSN